MVNFFKKTYILPVTAGIFLGLSFTGLGIGFLVAAAFALLLIYHRKSVEAGKSIYTFCSGIYLSFFIFNLIACSWITLASIFGGLSEILINSAIMSVPCILFAWAYRLKGRGVAKLMLLALWLGMEYLHTNWELEWPWLHLGNAFAFWPELVQWYRFTGVAGGTAWLLLLALSADAVILRWISHASVRIKATESALFTAILTIPIIISLAMPESSETAEHSEDIVAVQPNFDPYGNDGLSHRNRLSKLISQTQSAMDSNVTIVLWPEGAVEGALWENNLTERSDFMPVLQLSKQWPGAEFIVGASTFRRFHIEEATATSRKLPTGGEYDVYNSLIHLRDGQIIGVRHKSKLVLGVEKIPFPGLMQYAASFIDWLGGSIGSLGSDDSLISFVSGNGDRITSLVCYESVFGEYAASQPSSLLTIHTNDGWWGNSLGHRQHFAYAKLRAIETQQYVGRSAYNGISGIINADGKVIQQVPYRTAGTARAIVPMLSSITFYQQNGDFIGRWASFLSIILTIYIFVQSQISRRK